MKYKSTILLLTLAMAFSLSGLLKAQISVQGTPYSSKAQNLNEVQLYRMSSFDVEKMKREDVFESQFKDIPPRFGKDFNVNIGYTNSGTFDVMPDGTKIWRVSIKSPGAISINLIFNKFYLPKGTTMFVYNTDKSHVLGAFTDLNNNDNRLFSTAPVKGDEIVIEFNSPAYVTESPEINVSKVIHGYKNIFNILRQKDYGGSGACNRNIICPEGDPYRDQIRAAVMLLTSSNTRICSGSMINNTRFDGTPFMLTANHCWDSSQPTWIIMFKYEAPTCPNPGGDGPLTYTISGTTLCAKNSASDFCLVKLSSKPPVNYNAYYAGWNHSNVPPTNGICIHHPDCDVKKISFINTPFTPTSYNNPAVPGDSSHWHVVWAQIASTGLTPVTEPGSSGSPVYNQWNQIVGQLHGGPSSCSASDKSDYYGKFDRSWTGAGSSATRLKDWLDSANTGVMFIGGYDPNSGPLSTYNLQTPAAGITITTIAGSTTTSTFNWDTASMSATYKWIFGSSLPTRLLAVPVTVRPWTVTLGQLDSYLASIGVAQGNSISGSWDVWAFRNNLPANDSLKAANGPRTITFTRYKPVLSAFNLVSPSSGSRVVSMAGSTAPVVFNWTKTAPGTVYKFFYASPDFSSQSNIKIRLTADNSGFDSTITRTSGNIDSILASMGLAAGDSTVGQWRVYGYSGTDSLASTQTNAITFKRAPLGNITIGTGTTSCSYPYYTLYEDARTQMLYRSSEIIAAGGNGNLITRIGFNVLSVGAPVMNGFTVRMQNYSGSDITGWVTSGNWVTVYAPASPYAPTSTGWQYIDLSTPFPYSISSNLLIEICYHNTSWTSNSTVAGTTVSGNTVYHHHLDNTIGCTMTGSSSVTARPNISLTMNLATGLGNHNGLYPRSFELAQNYPNPFNPVTKINFAIPHQAHVTLKIYDMLGREVKTLINENKGAGFFTVDFDASEFASGVYFYKLEAGEFMDIKKMILVK